MSMCRRHNEARLIRLDPVHMAFRRTTHPEALDDISMPLEGGKSDGREPLLAVANKKRICTSR